MDLTSQAIQIPVPSNAGTLAQTTTSGEHWWDSLIQNSDKLLGGVANIIAADRSGSYNVNTGTPFTQNNAPNSQWFWVAGILLAIVLLFVIFKK